MIETSWIRCPKCDTVMSMAFEKEAKASSFVVICPNCNNGFDWRLRFGGDFLRGATFRWQEYRAPSEVWDHDHCVLCLQTLTEIDLPGIERAGYVTTTSKEDWWVCRRCFEELGRGLGWIIAPQGDRGGE